MDNQQLIASLLEKARTAQALFETFNQQQVDAVARAFGKVFFDNAELLAREAVEETGMGRVDSKIRKHRNVALSHWDFIKDKKSVGIIEEDPAAQVALYAKPIGVIACISPTTNPTSSILSNGIYAVKCRNAVIVAPHPRAKKVSAHRVNLVREAIVKAGGPADLLQLIEDPSIELTQMLMRECDATIATGGPAMVKAAYSSGRPSFGVGPGNVQSVMDRGCEELWESYAQGTITCRNVDNGIQCTAEQILHLPAESTEAILDVFVRNGAFVVRDEAAVNTIRSMLFTDGKLNVSLVGKTAPELAAIFGFTVPGDTQVLIAKAAGPAKADVLCKEKLCPVLAYLPYDTFEQAVDHAVLNLKMEGAGHSSILFSHDRAHVEHMAMRIPVARLAVNTANTVAGGNTPQIGFKPTMSLGCGTWGNNSISENLTYRHLMNITAVGYLIKDAPAFDPEKVWA